jgi:DNA-binding PadR family transcriptional regulator
MDCKTVCLGLLTLGEASGYDLRKHIDASFEHFFAAGYGSIYPALAALAEEGLVTCSEVAQDRRPDRKVYRITPLGRERLQQELEGSLPGHKLRSEFLATVYFAHLMSGERLAEIIDHRIAELERSLETFDSGGCSEMPGQAPGVRFVNGFGRTVVTAALDYLRTSRAELLASSNRSSG